jgi:FMN phosphatase YigB (HAD superfamily)
VLTSAEVVFLLDVDNTLLDNDRFIADLSARLDHDFGEAERRRYWAIFEELREQLGCADYLGALQKFRAGSANAPALLQMSAFLLDYPFNQRLYPHAIATIEHLRTIGSTVILSDGDIVFQPRKIKCAGLWDAVEARVLVYLHKEQMIAEIQRRFPAEHYVMIDDKLQLLTAMKRVLEVRLTTVFVRQGHYAAESARFPSLSAPDVTVKRIGDLCDFSLAQFHTVEAPRAVKEDNAHTPRPNDLEVL